MKNYAGNLLIANPTNPEDDLSRAVLLCLSHTKDVSIALQINKLQTDNTLSSIARNLNIQYYGNDPIWYGGNIAVDKVHIIHSLDWRGVGTIPLTNSIGVTHDISILMAIAQDEGPAYLKACAGYWLFDKGRLDKHLGKERDPLDPFKWEILPADIDNVFNTDHDILWEACLQQSIQIKVKSYF